MSRLAVPTGIGAACAKRLAQDGYDLMIVARPRKRLEALTEQLRAKYPVSVEVLIADLSKPADVRNVETRMAEDPALELLVNNTGFGSYMPFIAWSRGCFHRTLLDG